MIGCYVLCASCSQFVINHQNCPHHSSLVHNKLCDTLVVYWSAAVRKMQQVVHGSACLLLHFLILQLPFQLLRLSNLTCRFHKVLLNHIPPLHTYSKEPRLRTNITQVSAIEPFTQLYYTLVVDLAVLTDAGPRVSSVCPAGCSHSGWVSLSCGRAGRAVAGPGRVCRVGWWPSPS